MILYHQKVHGEAFWWNNGLELPVELVFEALPHRLLCVKICLVTNILKSLRCDYNLIVVSKQL